VGGGGHRPISKTQARFPEDTVDLGFCSGGSKLGTFLYSGRGSSGNHKVGEQEGQNQEEGGNIYRKSGGGKKFFNILGRIGCRKRQWEIFNALREVGLRAQH